MTRKRTVFGKSRKSIRPIKKVVISGEAARGRTDTRAIGLQSNATRTMLLDDPLSSIWLQARGSAGVARFATGAAARRRIFVRLVSLPSPRMDLGGPLLVKLPTPPNVPPRTPRAGRATAAQGSSTWLDRICRATSWIVSRDDGR